MVRIANVPFTIVGVLSKKGQNAGNGRDQDDVALLPLSTAKLRGKECAHKKFERPR
jgi:hypothetical protein